MSKYQSEVKVITAAQLSVWNRISDFSQFQVMKDNMTTEQKEMIKQKLAEQSGGKIEIKNVRFDSDTVTFNAGGFDATFRIVEREDDMKCVKYKADNSPIDATLWIQLLPKAPYETKCRVTLDIDIPFYLKPMVGKKLDGVADQIADMLCKIPY